MALRVLHIGKFYPPHRGGMEVFLADLITAQRAAGIEATALVHGTPEPLDPPWLTRVPVQFQLVYAPVAIGFRRALARAIEQHQPDVLHLHMPNNSALWVLTLASACGLPWVVHWHSDVVVSRLRTTIALAYRLYRPFEQAVLARASRIIATSPPYLQTSNALETWRDKCAVVPLGLGSGLGTGARPGYGPQTQPVPATLPVSTKSLAQQDTADQTTPYSPPTHPWSPGRLRVLSIGRLTYYKGFETLIQAVARVPDAELLIVGDGELKPALQRLIQSLASQGSAPRMRLLGNVDDTEKNALLDTCDVFCLASRERTEAFGVALLEAMAHSKPCIVSALTGSGMPWIVETSGAGLLAPVEDAIAWAEAIQHMHAHPEQRLQWGQAAQRSVYQRFSMSVCASAMDSQYALAAPGSNSRTDNTTHLSQNPRDHLLIVIPARNEAATIGAVLSRLQTEGWRHVLVVNDQSTDNTEAIARAAGAQVLSPPLPVGAWGGMQTGIRYALRHGYQIVITMDADGQHEVDEITTLLEAQPQADLVVGAYPERASQLRQLAWNWFRKLAGFDLRDLTSGFRLYNRDVMEVLASREATLLDYQDLGALLLVRRAGLKIAEVPVTMNMRIIGKSRIFNSWSNVAKYMLATSLLCLARWNHTVRRTK